MLGMQLLRAGPARSGGPSPGTFIGKQIPKTSFPLNVRDDSNVRTPHGHWKIRDVERWIAEYLRISAGSVMLRGNPNVPVGSLRKKQDR
jgi:hypothetical protein